MKFNRNKNEKNNIIKLKKIVLEKIIFKKMNNILYKVIINIKKHIL